MALVRCCVVLPLVYFLMTGAGRAADLPALVPQPGSVYWKPCAGDGLRLNRALRFARDVDPGGFALVRERWRALGITPPVRAARADVTARVSSPGGGPAASAQYTLAIDPATVRIAASSGDLSFDALATLAQLPVRRGAAWMLPCATIVDRPALRWRIVSDDISRGPFPTMRYFKERIRTLAGLKINGWSPYMEQVFFDPLHPYVAFPNAISAAQLHALAAYARFYHVALIPQQQTLAHMHETLKYERLAGLAELPHGFLLSPADSATDAYLEPLLRAELAAAGRVPFFHIGADEPLDLGRGRTPRTAQVFAAHVTRLSAVVAARGARPMIWDDAIQQDPSILRLIPKRTIVVTFHYGAEPSFAKYIATVSGAGFEQFVSPGANNWNEIYADLDTAYLNEARFIADGKAAHVLGVFETVWHDDGESLFEAAWAPVAFAAASAWQTRPVDRAGWHTAFARAFFGSDDPRFARDLDALAAARAELRRTPLRDPPDYLFWRDPFAARVPSDASGLDVAAVRRHAEDVLAHLARSRPPLHRNAAEVMRLAALRYDALGRRFQIGVEARSYYADARAHVAEHADPIVYRGLNVAKYLCWELRDEMTALEPLYVRAWRYESTPPGLARVLVRYHAAAAQAVVDADRLNAAAREDYLRRATLPEFDRVLDRAN
jgi:hexosaminidase